MTELLKLTEMASAALKAKHPSVPIYALPRVIYTDRTANGLTRCIIDFIRLDGGHAERVANMGGVIKNRGGKQQYIPGTGTNGSADIHSTKNGRFIAIEVKVKRDKQSFKQKEYQDKVEASGAVYLIAKDFDDFIKQWEAL